ncbi:MAG TPA: DUF5658 family protein [Phycisphaerae bacterium]|nr:DUF5658 family protein [Phycisphaerae bacterium]HRR86068.1 DUF5658 family protein [Phycisphaerae bacterium]
MEVLLPSSSSCRAACSRPADPGTFIPSRPRERQDRRFIWLLIGVWIVNCFDLELTLLAAHQRMLWELNPVVGRVLPFGPKGLTCYKFALLGFGSLVLWRYRRYRVAVVALWIVAIACVGLSLVWYQLYFGAEPTWGGINTSCIVSG